MDDITAHPAFDRERVLSYWRFRLKDGRERREAAIHTLQMADDQITTAKAQLARFGG